MIENYAKASNMDLAEWLSLNPPPVICERKFDGFRVFLFKSGQNILLTTRHGRIYSDSTHPALFLTLKPLLDLLMPKKLLLDGEYVSPDKLYVFDVLRLDEQDTTTLPLDQRKEILSNILHKNKQAKSLEVEIVRARNYGEIRDFMNDQLNKGAEGIVAKNPSSKYGERNSWVKLKRFDTVDCFVTRFEKTQEMEKTGIPHSWYIALYNSAGEAVEMGKVGTYLKEVDPRKIKTGTVVEIRYLEVTEDLKFRQPFIVRIREDKRAKECTTSQIRS